MSREGSKKSLLKRDGSENKLVQNNQLGPQIMKQKVNQNVGYNQWNQGPLHSAQKENMMGSSQKPKPSVPDFKANSDSDDNYDDGFEEKGADDDGMDEMEKIRQAMARQKEKATKFNNKNLNNKPNLENKG